MDVRELLASVPKVLPHSTQQPELQYQLLDDLVATPAAAGLAVRAVDAGDVDAATPVMPVYRRGEGGGVVVPTGRVLVRFADGDSADAHRDELAAAGYDLEEVLGYAPQAGWVRATSGSIADTLGHLDRLQGVPGVENVEVQMVGDVGWR
ncbi:MAG TPA: hypothetical protein VHG90_06990 [Acidimicrobiales bacterium]|nr:hypothetical protein [Acidimicrobiales bacterium]